MTGDITHVADPTHNGPQAFPGGRGGWSSVAGRNDFHILGPGYFIITNDQLTDSIDTARVLHDIYDAWRRGGEVGWKGLISPRDGLGGQDLAPFAVDLQRRVNLNQLRRPTSHETYLLADVSRLVSRGQRMR